MTDGNGIFVYSIYLACLFSGIPLLRACKNRIVNNMCVVRSLYMFVVVVIVEPQTRTWNERHERELDGLSIIFYLDTIVYLVVGCDRFNRFKPFFMNGGMVKINSYKGHC